MFGGLSRFAVFGFPDGVGPRSFALGVLEDAESEYEVIADFRPAPGSVPPHAANFVFVSKTVANWQGTVFGRARQRIKPRDLWCAFVFVFFGK